MTVKDQTNLGFYLIGGIETSGLLAEPNMGLAQYSLIDGHYHMKKFAVVGEGMVQGIPPTSQVFFNEEDVFSLEKGRPSLTLVGKKALERCIAEVRLLPD
ncbi:hypothetical protein KY306_00680 [Candidatus Woesearchaeota archaeon]|nr:hypothetical protein [Candidatus Woesearchaeota archaeon]